MTREEAISWLVSLTEHEGEDVPIYDDDVEALNMAIEALEHPERNVVAIVPCGDCISRADAIKAMQNKAKKLKNEDTINGLCGAVAILYEMPSVTPQPKHGIWQQINKNEVNVIPEYKCSECGAEYKGFGFDFDYCPRCGCAMEVEE